MDKALFSTNNKSSANISYKRYYCMYFDYPRNLSIEEDQEKLRAIGASIFQFGVNRIYLYKGTCTCLCELDCASGSLEYLRVYHVSYENETGMKSGCHSRPENFHGNLS